MSPDDQATRSAARCSTHLASPSVAVCHSCGRALCLRCAVPVRGEVFGRECLPDVLGPDELAPPTAVPPRSRNAVVNAVGLGLIVSTAATVLPWTRFGVGSGLFGGWGVAPLRWSDLAAGSSLLGLAAWFLLRAMGRATGGPGPALIASFASAALAGAVLHGLDPPPFTHAWLGPWVVLGGASVSFGASVWLLLRGIRSPSIP